MSNSVLESKYVKDIDKAFVDGQFALAVQISLKALHEEKEDEKLNAILILGLCDNKVPCYENIKKFLELFPDSRYPVRVMWAEILCSDSNFDDCASEARYYLRLTLEDFQHDFTTITHHLTLEYVLKSHILAVTIYMACGARSYAIRILELAKAFATETWMKHYDAEIANLQKDLQEQELKELDAKWEAFYKDSSHYIELYQLCAEKGYTEMAIRTRLIYEDFQNVADHKIDEREFYKIVLIKDDKEYVLG
jgi:hypothetical protein